MNIFENINMTRFLDNLHYVAEGMLCIFIVIGIIIASIYGLNFFTSKFKRNKKDKKEN